MLEAVADLAQPPITTNLPAHHPADDGAKHRLTIDVFFDLICPWSWVGIRQLAAAMHEFQWQYPAVGIQINWRSRPLLPEVPLGGTAYQPFYLAQSGSPTAVAMRRSQVQHAGQAVGIAFDFKRIRILPNTAIAHGLIEHMAKQASPLQTIGLVERLFKAFFSDGENIGDPHVLERLGLEHGVGRPMLLACLNDVRSHLPPPAPERPRRGRPVKEEILSTPHFVFNGAATVSGARSTESLLMSMLRSVEGT
ncbi:DsbA family protein [Ralstonia insidiosa]|nr:DsbA family protein [Ralstonia insidiosa]MBX3774414.1 DsbA family protein [Ralstonia pickettii]NOZ18671.1 DsbA family oxidoreductase [Betaproteobacteria bacterium]MBC9963748.1 DsbA family protein [Ralstonia insidiosa]MBX3812189.1 DsbA family protein [Ralstonia pickettii]MBX3818042.1 DsbA family protein [Ralstonia insidiosa]